jgi:sialate O-acetylesterase
MSRSYIPLCCLVLVLLPGLSPGAVEPASIFSDHAVLQRELPIPVWGRAAPGETVRVQCAGNEASTTADADGRWLLQLDPLPAGGSHQMTISGENRIVLEDILVGEVWLASGQSNMVWKLDMCFRSDAAMAAMVADPLPRVRLRNGGQGFGGSDWKPFAIPADLSPKDRSKWFGNMPGLPFYFVRELAEALGPDIPIGIVCQSWGNSKEVAWMSRAVLQADPELRERYIDGWVLPEPLGGGRGHKVTYTRNGEERSEPIGWIPGVMYERYIVPVVPYAFRGVLWWQGQSGGVSKRRLSSLISSWREAFGRELPFYIVGFVNKDEGRYLPREPGDTQTVYAGYRLNQLELERELPRVQSVFIADLAFGDAYHPQEKEGAATRLAERALAVEYEADLQAIGPRLVAAERLTDGRVRLDFDRALKLAHGAAAHGFSLAGRDYDFEPAQAMIDGDSSIVLDATGVDAPAWVALGYSGSVNHHGHWNLYADDAFRIPARMPYGPDGSSIDTRIGWPARPFVRELEPAAAE